MRGHVTSLNASVAASLLMYEVLRKRQPLNRRNEKKNVLLVDGYNIIGAWGELQQMKEHQLADARDQTYRTNGGIQGIYGMARHCRFRCIYGAWNREKETNT